MTITEIKIRKTYTEGRLKAVVSVVLNGCLAIHEVRIIQGDDRLFVAMPSCRENDGTYRDIIHPIGEAARTSFEAAVINAYMCCVANHEITVF